MSKKCVTGCKHFTGGDIMHHKDCPNYPNSVSKMYKDNLDRLEKLEKELIGVKRSERHQKNNAIKALLDLNEMTKERNRLKEKLESAYKRLRNG